MSILSVDQISPIGSGTTITLNATEVKTGNEITVGTGASIFSPAGNTLALGTNNVERIRIKNDGKVGIGTNNPTAKLEIKGSDNPLVKIVQDTSGIARLNLESATNDGYQYSGIGLGDGTNDAELMWTTGGFDVNVGNAVRLRINSNGAWGAGTNFGSAGQVLTSQGSGSPVQWATPATPPAGWVHTATTALNGSSSLTLTGVPDGASHIRYLIRYMSCTSSTQPAFRVQKSTTGGSKSIITANYQSYAAYFGGNGTSGGGTTDRMDIFDGYSNPANNMFGTIDIYRVGTNGSDGTNYLFNHQGFVNYGGTLHACVQSNGYIELGTGTTDFISGAQFFNTNGVNFDNGHINQSYLLS